MVNRILLCDWLPERPRWHYLARSGIPAVSREKIAFFFHIVNPLLARLDQLRLLDIGLVLYFCVFMDLDQTWYMQKHAKKKHGQYPAILTSRLVNNPYIHCPDWSSKTITECFRRVTCDWLIDCLIDVFAVVNCQAKCIQWYCQNPGNFASSMVLRPLSC